MAAYMVIIHSEVTDWAQLAKLSDELAVIVESNGGRFLIRGGAIEAKDGDTAPPRLVVAEFDNVDEVRALFELDSFKEVRERRRRFTKADAFIVQGV